MYLLLIRFLTELQLKKELNDKDKGQENEMTCFIFLNTLSVNF